MNYLAHLPIIRLKKKRDTKDVETEEKELNTRNR